MTERRGIPEKLYRIVKSDGLEFDDEGYLLPHTRENFLRRLFFRGSVPMVELEDVETVKNYFGADENWTELEVSSDEVENIKAGSHAYLKKPEYFSKIPKSAIVSKKNVIKG